MAGMVGIRICCGSSARPLKLRIRGRHSAMSDTKMLDRLSGLTILHYNTLEHKARGSL